jgi:Leucine-rich repeat (LRR) protein
MSTAAPTQSQSSRFARLRPQWSLRTLLVAVALLSIPLGFFTWKAREINAEMNAAEALERSGWFVERHATPRAKFWSRLLQREVHVIVGLHGDDFRQTSLDAYRDQVHALSDISTLHVSNLPFTDRLLGNLPNRLSLSHVALEGTQLTDDGLRWLSHCPKLSHLNLCNTRVSDLGIGQLRSLPLIELNLCQTDCTDASIEAIQSLSQLQILDLDETRVNRLKLSSMPNLVGLSAGDQLSQIDLVDLPSLQIVTLLAQDGAQLKLQNTPALRVLRIFADSMAADTIPHAKDIPALESLCLSFEGDISEIARLKDARRLTDLDLSSQSFTSSEVNALAQLRNLKRLGLLGIQCEVPFDLGLLAPVEDIEISLRDGELIGFQALRAWTSLDRLHVGYDVADEDMAHLGALRQLRELLIESDEITDRGVAHLAGCRSLESLHLIYSPRVTDEALATLAALPNLRFLNLSGVPITDAGIKLLSACPRLESLDLEGTQITDACLGTLAKMKVAVTGLEATGVAPDAADRFFHLQTPPSY